MDIEPSIEVKDVDEAVRGFFNFGLSMDLKMCLTKRSFRGTRQAYVRLEKVQARELIKVNHIKIFVALST